MSIGKTYKDTLLRIISYCLDEQYEYLLVVIPTRCIS